MNPLRVLHIASHEINVGDGALNDAIRRTVERLHGGPVQWTLQDVGVFRHELTAQEADTHDLVIVGGGGGISNGPHAARTGTPMPMALEEYRAATTPFAFVGLGHNLFAGDPFRHAAALAALLEAAEQKGDGFAVRNDGSLQRLIGDIGPLAERTITEIPDPGFFVAAAPDMPIEASERPYVLIQVAGDSLGRRVRQSLIARVKRRIRATEASAPISDGIAVVALDLWRRHGLDIFLAPHIHHDVPICSAILKQLYARAGKDALHRPFRMGGTPHPRHATAYFAAYAHARMVIGMRGHAVICGVGLRRPVIALSSHPKVAGFMIDCGLADWSVDLADGWTARLAERSDRLLADDTRYFENRDRSVEDFDARFDAVIARAVERARARRAGR